jgi:excinuclease UvrABC nuclease subunit
MKKCLGPCVGGVSDAEYRAVAEEADRVLRGRDTGVLERATERRDALAEAWRFEEAAELRDRMRDLEQVIGVQRRLATFSERNSVLVTADRQRDRARLLFIRAGRLIDEVSVSIRATPSHLRLLLRRTVTQPTSTQLARDELDDVLILDAWLRRQQAHELPVGLEAPEAAVSALRKAMLKLATPGAEASAPRR